MFFAGTPTIDMDDDTMTKRFQLYWLKESGCDLGTPVDADELDAAIRSRVVGLARKKRSISG